MKKFCVLMSVYPALVGCSSTVVARAGGAGAALGGSEEVEREMPGLSSGCREPYQPKRCCSGEERNVTENWWSFLQSATRARTMWASTVA